MRQAAAFPYRLVDGAPGSVEMLLVTSGSGRWIIPKGDTDGMPAHLAAEKEAFEEGGVKGRILDQAIGSFSFRKKEDGVNQPVRVEVYPLEVRVELDRWPEDDRRQRCWLSLHDAARKVDEPELGAIISRFRP